MVVPILLLLAIGSVLLWLWWWDVPLRLRLLVRRYILGDKSAPQLPPGGCGFPLVGHLPWLLWDYIVHGSQVDLLGNYQSKKREQYGEIRCGSLPPLGARLISLSSEETLRWAWAHENRGLVGEWPESTATLLGSSSLAVVTGSLHKRLRSALAPIFQGSFLSKYVDRVNEIAQQHMQSNWPSRGGSKQLNVREQMNQLTFKITCDLILGIDIDKDHHLVERLMALFEIWSKGLFMPTTPFPGNPYPKALKARNDIESELLPIIRRRRSEEQIRDDALQLLVSPIKMDGGELCHLTDAEILDTLVTFMFAGYETTSCTMTWLVQRLIDYPSVFAKLREEHMAIRNAHQQSWSNISWEEIESLRYSHQVIFESMRMNMPVKGGFRKATKDLQYRGFLIPKGYKVSLELENTCKSTIKDERFAPDRFRSENPMGAFHGFKPFGGGVRKCIGYKLATAEMNVFLHHIVLNYNLRPSPDASDKKIFFPIPFPADGLPVVVSTA